MDCGPDALVDRYPFFAGNQVIGMRDDLLFRCPGNTIAGIQPQQRAFVRGETGPGMAFHDTGKVFAKTPFAYEICPALGMTDIMGQAPADIMEHRTPFNTGKIDIGIMFCISAGTVPYCPAVGNDFCAAPGVFQQVFAGYFLFFRHGQATS
jgi:hypothetical protein